NFFSQLEILVVFRLAKILRLKKFGQADDLRALFRRVANEIDCAREILVRIRATPHLYQCDFGHLIESAGTMSILLITIRLVVLLILPVLFWVTGLSRLLSG